MKKIQQLSRKIILLLIFTLPCISLANFNLNSPYIGLNLGIKSCGFLNNYGGNLFKNKQPVINIFFGLENIIPSLSLEINAETTTRTKRIETLSNNDIFFGTVMGKTITWKSCTKTYGIGIDLIYKFNPICCEQFKLLFGVGLKTTKLKLKVENIRNGKFMELKNNRNSTVKLFAGYEYNFRNNVGIRGLLSWENTSNIKAKGYNSYGDLFNAVLKNNIIYTLGVVYKY